ncbi:F-box only protein 21 [Procambarus clarkii]|uniref:F-box only protein 21 n=1 Tax=Procambarus clarkii TaxID=6728 RepID=UPI001E672B94|nr:F-box only protein 21-like isoform X2 [Procambarus clarkii]
MDGSTSCILHRLPDELLLRILSCDCITVHDLATAAASCSRLRNIVETQRLWRVKVKSHWPKVWDELPCKHEVVDWHDEVKQLMCFSKQVRKLVSGLSPRLYQDLHLTANLHLTTPVYNEVDALVASTNYAPYYVLNALRMIVEDGEQYENMTEKYYALKVMSHVHQGICIREWEEFMARPPAQQSLETGAILMARWFQPHADVSVKQVTSQIDDIAKECLKELRVNHSDHPMLSAALILPSQILQESKWSPERCRQLFKCINHVLFTQMKMTGNSEDYYNLKNSLINEVLSTKKGIPITMCIIYMAVCHRLGLHLEPVNYPSHFVIRWKIPGTYEYEYIDAFNKGQRPIAKVLRGEMPEGVGLDQMPLTSCGPMQVFHRMIRNIMSVAQMQGHIFEHIELFCPATELMSLLIPADRSVQGLLLRIYYSLEVHYDRIVTGCRRLLAQDASPIYEEMLSECEQILKNQSVAPKPIEPNFRSKEIAYATGLVMQHKRYNYTCVIFGWDKECKMPPEWVHRMGVHNLQYKTKQPFYNVLVYDGSHRYAAQENLEVALQPTPVTHADVGKYFKVFTGTHYIPNAELLKEYPEDEAVRNVILRARGLL